MNRYITFTEEAQVEIDDCFDLAKEIWGGDYSDVRVLAGNVAGYGKHLAHYVVNAKIIEIPLNPTFEMAKITGAGMDIVTVSRFKGVLLHELAHHYAHYHLGSQDFKAGYSTHTTPKWCHVCAVGWNYFDAGLKISPKRISIGIRNKTPGLAKAMAAFDPYNPPYEILESIKEESNENICQYCKKLFVTKRKDAKYCSGKCRVSAHRKNG